MKLPILQSTDRIFQMMQDKWSSIINPLLANPSNQASILSGITLKIGSNVINHLLGKSLQGYRIILKSAPASIYDKQSSNQTPDRTLILVSDAVTTVSIEVF